MPNCSICETAQPSLIRMGKQEVCQSCLEDVSAEVAARGHDSRKIMKIRKGKEIAGVCGGLADSMNMDRDTLRIIVALAAVFTGFFPILIAYLVLAWVLPTEPETAS